MVAHATPPGECGSQSHTNSFKANQCHECATVSLFWFCVLVLQTSCL